MRPGQNRRVRGRSRNKGPNPLTRSYESNGPDVKIRGTAQHVADKYAQLSRDSTASGDPVSAENYLQHAEHYYRLIAAAQEQFRQQYGVQQRPFDEDGEDGDEEGLGPNGFGYPQQDRQMQAGPEDEFGDNGSGPPYQAPPQNYNPRGGNGERPPQGRFDRQDRGGYDRGPERGPERAPDRQPDRGQRFDRNDRFDRTGGRNQGGPRFDRGANGGQNGERYDRQDGQRERFDRGGDNRNGENRRDVRSEPRLPRQDQQRGAIQEESQETGPGLPAFLTAPTRPAIAVEPERNDDDGAQVYSGETNVESDAQLNGIESRPRRRRARRPEADVAGSGPEVEKPAE